MTVQGGSLVRGAVETISLPTKNSKEPKIIEHTPRVAIDAKYCIKLSQDAYDHMRSSTSPYWYRKAEWIKLRPLERLRLYLARIAESYNALSYSFEILED